MWLKTNWKISPVPRTAYQVLLKNGLDMNKQYDFLLFFLKAFSNKSEFFPTKIKSPRDLFLFNSYLESQANFNIFYFHDTSLTVGAFGKGPWITRGHVIKKQLKNIASSENDLSSIIEKILPVPRIEKYCQFREPCLREPCPREPWGKKGACD